MECIRSPQIQDKRKEIAFDDLEATDSILIQTQNSTYHFWVIDPPQRRGILSGGLLGEDSHHAALAASLLEDENGFRPDYSGLKTGLRGLFYIETNNQLEGLITSAIMGLDHIRRGASLTISRGASLDKAVIGTQ